MTGHNTTTKKYTLGQQTALDAMMSPRTMWMLNLAVDKKLHSEFFAELEANPKNGPRYINNSGSLPFMYLLSEIHSGIVCIEAKKIDSEEDLTLFEHAEYSTEYCIEIGRLFEFKRSHDIGEFSEYVRGSALWIAEMFNIREKRRTAIKKRASALAYDKKYPSHGILISGRPKSLARMCGAEHRTPQDRIRFLVTGAITRWMPAMQNIISRLPVAERQIEANIAEEIANKFLINLSKLSTMCKNPNDEHEWAQSGYGAIDAAVSESALLLAYAASTARRMVDDGTEIGSWAESLRRNTDDAWTATREELDSLARTRLHSMWGRLDRRGYAARLRFGHATGGVAPSLELLYHAKGSSFLGV